MPYRKALGSRTKKRPRIIGLTCLWHWASWHLLCWWRGLCSQLVQSSSASASAGKLGWLQVIYREHAVPEETEHLPVSASTSLEAKSLWINQDFVPVPFEPDESVQHNSNQVCYPHLYLLSHTDLTCSLCTAALFVIFVVIVGGGGCGGVFCLVWGFGWIFLRGRHLFFVPCFAETLFRKGISDWCGLITFLVCWSINKTSL